MKPAHTLIKQIGNKFFITVAFFVCFNAAWSLHYINTQSDQLYQRAESSIAKVQKKSHAMTQMAHAIQNRSITLLKMLNERDAFVKDALNQALFRHASSFQKHRDFLQTSKLNKRQTILLEDLLKLTGENAEIQMSVAILLLDDKKNRAANALFDTAIPNQIPMTKIIKAFLKIFDEETAILLDELQVELDTNQKIMMLLSFTLSAGVIFLLATFINVRKHSTLT